MENVTLEEVSAVNQKFNNWLQGNIDDLKRFERYEKFYGWLEEVRSISDDGSELEANVIALKLRIIQKLIGWVTSSGFRLKDYSKNWNVDLIMSTVNFIKRWKDVSISKRYDQLSTYKQEYQTLFHLIYDCTDFPTKIYCFKMLVIDNFINLNSIADDVIEIYKKRSSKTINYKLKDSDDVAREILKEMSEKKTETTYV